MLGRKIKKLIIGLAGGIVTGGILFTIGVLWPLDQAEPIKNDKPIAITDASIIDLYSGKILKNQTVIIRNNKILSVGLTLDIVIPEDAIQIKAKNRYLMPALWDMHTHVFKITPMLDLPLYIAYGVTNVRDMMSCPKLGDPFVACPSDFKRWTKSVENNLLVGPRIQGITSWQLNGPGIHDYIKGLPEFFGTESPQQAKEFVDYYAGKIDALKVYNYIPKEAYFSLVAEAKNKGLAVVGHRPHAVSAIDAAKNQKSIEHARFILHESFSGSSALRAAAEKGQWHEDRRRMLDEHDPKMANAIFEAMKASGTYYVPTHLTRRVDAYGDDPLILEDPILKYLHPLLKWQWLEDVNKVINNAPAENERQTYREFYKKGLELTGQAHRAGVKVLVGTDYIVAGVTVHQELEQLTLAGLTPLDALRAATIYPAEYFGLQNQYGAVTAGMNADLILFNKNPLDDIHNSTTIESVIFNGNLYDRNQLNKIDTLVQNRAKSWSVACKILWEFIKSPSAY